MEKQLNDEKIKRKLLNNYKTLKRRINLIQNFKSYVHRLRNSENRVIFILKSIFESKLIIALLIFWLWLKTTYFYSLTISLAGLSKFEITGEKGDYNYKVFSDTIKGVNFFDYTSLITLIALIILVLPLLFIKKSKNRFKRSNNI